MWMDIRSCNGHLTVFRRPELRHRGMGPLTDMETFGELLKGGFAGGGARGSDESHGIWLF